MQPSPFARDRHSGSGAPASECRWPEFIRSEAELDELLTRPGVELIRDIRRLESPLLVVGAGGKMGPSLAVLARRAAAEAGMQLEVIAASRFSSSAARAWLEDRGVATRVCDLLDSRSVAALPDSANIVYLAGQKFGTSANPSLTWAVNAIPPVEVTRRFPAASLVALSTGNVYPPSAIGGGGAVETDPLTPVGEYANAAVARERLFEYQSRLLGTRVGLIRLNYALDLRYGVLTDLALRVRDGLPVDLSTGAFNCIWQGEANERILRSLALGLCTSPASAWNLTGPAMSVREAATRLGEHLGRAAQFTGEEPRTALLSNTGKLDGRLGGVRMDPGTLIRWAAHWIRSGGGILNKPTHFEVRDGVY